MKEWVFRALPLTLFVAVALLAQDAPPWADVQLGPGVTAVILRDTKGADQIMVTTFYWQRLKGIEKPVLRTVTEVVPAVKDVAVAAQGAPDPKDVESVHVSTVRITDRMEWRPVPQKDSSPK